MSKTISLKRALGNNVAASIDGGQDCAPQSPADRRFVDRHRDDAAARISLDRIVPDPRQPRKTFDQAELKELADSLRAHGQLQPCVVRWDAVLEKYCVVAGERRHRAAKLAGLKDLRCVVWDLDQVNDAVRIRELQLIENLLRVDLPPLEQAEAYRELMKSSGLNGKALAAKLHVNPGTVSRALSLLTLPDTVREGVERGVISPSVAYEVSKAPKEKQKNLAAAAVDGKLTRDEVATRVKATKTPTLEQCTIPKSSKPAKAEPVICSNLAPYVWTSVKGETVRITPRSGRRTCHAPAAADRARSRPPSRRGFSICRRGGS